MSTAVRWFRVAAIAEACSWAGLLVGMFFKYVVVHNAVGVKIFGPIHGALFVAYLISLLAAHSVAGWGTRTTVIGVIASVPPLATLWFERWAIKRVPAKLDAVPQVPEGQLAGRL